MPVETDLRLADGDHVVQFYDGDDQLVGLVVGYLSAAVLDGDAAIVIATPAHRDAFRAALRAAGVDVPAAQGNGRIVLLDAGRTLSRFMVDGRPDPAAFDAVVGDAVRRAAAGGRQVKAYGEMVAVLWAEGNVIGALELERLWNGLGEHLPFSLFCAYPALIAAADLAAESFSEVCHLHSRVVGDTATPPGCEVAQTFARSTRAPGLARRFVSDTLRRWDRADLLDDGAMVVSELASNAVLHGGSDVTVALSRRGSRVRMVVGDSSQSEPVLRQPGPAVLGGRGLHVVSAVAHRWGYDVDADGKLVWAELGAV
jgi:anti-sigma regulatory factor (Ser/Thr protein kinase)